MEKIMVVRIELNVIKNIKLQKHSLWLFLHFKIYELQCRIRLLEFSSLFFRNTSRTDTQNINPQQLKHNLAHPEISMMIIKLLLSKTIIIKRWYSKR